MMEKLEDVRAEDKVTKQEASHGRSEVRKLQSKLLVTRFMRSFQWFGMYHG